MTATLPSLALLDDCGRRPYRGRSRLTPSSPSIMAWMKPRTRSRTTASIGSNQSSKRYTAVSATGCEESCFATGPGLVLTPSILDLRIGLGLVLARFAFGYGALILQ